MDYFLGSERTGSIRDENPLPARRPPVLAVDEKPAAEIKSQAIEASITINAKLSAHPGLYAKRLADGKKEIEN
jgi:hypothetical protein